MPGRNSPCPCGSGLKYKRCCVQGYTRDDVAGAYEALAIVRKDAPASLIEAALHASQQDIRVRGLSLLVREAEKQGAGVAELLGDAIEDEAADVRREALRTLWALRKDDSPR